MGAEQTMSRISKLARGSIAALAFASVTAMAVADEPSLDIELNKIEDSAEGCRSVFVFDNRTGHDLNRFRIDLILFDAEGVYAKQLLLDMAPLYDDKKTVASFMLAEGPCDSIGSVLVNDVPWCENGTGSPIDCVRLLDVSSKAELPLQK
jgi:hypothetical protein